MHRSILDFQAPTYNSPEHQHTVAVAHNVVPPAVHMHTGMRGCDGTAKLPAVVATVIVQQALFPSLPGVEVADFSEHKPPRLPDGHNSRVGRPAVVQRVDVEAHAAPAQQYFDHSNSWAGTEARQATAAASNVPPIWVVVDETRVVVLPSQPLQVIPHLRQHTPRQHKPQKNVSDTALDKAGHRCKSRPGQSPALP